MCDNNQMFNNKPGACIIKYFTPVIKGRLLALPLYVRLWGWLPKVTTTLA
jgi:hypothetical protein